MPGGPERIVAIVVGPAFHLRQHDHEEECDDDRAGVDDDRPGGQERRIGQ
jgi:hypothetical protein